MSIYKEKYNNEIHEKSELEIFNESLNNFKETLTKIILQKETREPFFKINNINEIIKVIKSTKVENMEKEIDFIEKEFAELEKDYYIKNYLLDDLINFSKKDKFEKLINGIIYFIEAYRQISTIKKTEFIINLTKLYEIIRTENVTGEEIKEVNKVLNKLKYNIDDEIELIQFYELFLDKENSILFFKRIKDDGLDIRNLNEFIDENENSQLQTTDIDNLIDVYNFFQVLIENKKIETDEDFHTIFRKNFENHKDIIKNLQIYLSTYGEIIQLYDSYVKNPEITTEKVYKLLKNSSAEIFMEEKIDSYIFQIKYLNKKKEEIINLKDIEDLKNKILISSTNTNLLKYEDNKNIINKEELTKQFVTLIDNIKQLTNTLNSLLNSGYSNKINLILIINDSNAFVQNRNRKSLEEIIEEYRNINKNFKKSIKEGYIKFPLLRLFYGKQFIRLFEKASDKKINISNLVNSMAFNKIRIFNVSNYYRNALNINSIEKINTYLEILFYINGVNMDEIYEKNKVKENSYLYPGLYRNVKIGDNSELIFNILNIYINLTGNAPIINTVLICNEETNIEKIRAFLYRAIFCDKPILFLITNMECLELSLKQSIFKTLKDLYQLKKRNINSYLLLMYEKVDSGLSRDIEKLIPEKNLLIINDLLKRNLKPINLFKEIELYSSKFAGYGKTTEIIHKVNQKRGKYYYLPIGGSFTRNFLINNLENLNINLENAKNSYLHIDISESDNDDLMNEILFNLLILKFIDSNDKIFYLGYDINIIIEIPRGFTDFEEKYKILKLFNKHYIDKL